MSATRRSPVATRTAMALAVLFLVFALLVRGAKPAAVVRPEDQPPEEPRLAQPLQLLARGSALRVAELDPWVSKERLPEWKAVRGSLFALQDCPATLDFLETAEGQRLERCVASLRGGTREDALAALVLLFELARATEWRPGLLGRTQHAERLGALLEGWLRGWSARSADDGLLVEPALSALLLYGRAMRLAWRAPLVGYNSAPYERARALLSEIAGESEHRSGFGQALQARYPGAARGLASDFDVLEGLEEACAVLYPRLLGECEER